MTEIDCGEITLIRFNNGRMAEIIINSMAKPITADMLVRVMTINGVTAAKITTRTAKEIPPPRFDQEGGGTVTS